MKQLNSVGEDKILDNYLIFESQLKDKFSTSANLEDLVNGCDQLKNFGFIRAHKIKNKKYLKYSKKKLFN